MMEEKDWRKQKLGEREKQRGRERERERESATQRGMKKGDSREG